MARVWYVFARCDASFPKINTKHIVVVDAVTEMLLSDKQRCFNEPGRTEIAGASTDSLRRAAVPMTIRKMGNRTERTAGQPVGRRPDRSRLTEGATLGSFGSTM